MFGMASASAPVLLACPVEEAFFAANREATNELPAGSHPCLKRA